MTKRYDMDGYLIKHGERYVIVPENPYAKVVEGVLLWDRKRLAYIFTPDLLPPMVPFFEMNPDGTLTSRHLRKVKYRKRENKFQIYTQRDLDEEVKKAYDEGYRRATEVLTRIHSNLDKLRRG